MPSWPSSHYYAHERASHARLPSSAGFGLYMIPVSLRTSSTGLGRWMSTSRYLCALRFHRYAVHESLLPYERSAKATYPSLPRDGSRVMDVLLLTRNILRLMAVSVGFMTEAPNTVTTSLI